MARGEKARSSRNPGRPVAGDPGRAREALLDAAGRLFAQHGTGEVSLRRIASEAGVTPAMVHYYFGGRDGLHDALLERAFASILERVGDVVARRGDPDNGADRLTQLLEVLTHTLSEQPWVPTLVVREVLAEGGRFREQFIREYAQRMASLLPDLARREIDEGHFRDDLDPRLAFLSFMGMAVFPFAARPIVERVLGIDYDDEFLRRFVEHTQRLFMEGAQR